MAKIWIFLALLVPTAGFAKVICVAEEKDAWLKDQRIKSETDSFFKYGQTKFGGLTSCSGKSTTEPGGQKFGTVHFVFKNAARFTIETQPPETTVVRLEAESGFPNESEAINKLKEIVSDVGLKIAWSESPEVSKSGDEETKMFWDPSEGTNGRGFLVYRKKKLVAVGYGMAL